MKGSDPQKKKVGLGHRHPSYHLTPLSLGTTSFKELRQTGQIYVDKTKIIYDILQKGKRYFFTRPRGFGKTLLISLLESYFKREVNLFEGLKIANLGFYSEGFPVVILDFAKVSNFEDEVDFNNQLVKLINSQFEPLGFKFQTDSVQSFWSQLSRWLKTQPKTSIVLLIDNYDAPFTACLIKTLYKKGIYSSLTDFYKVVHEHDHIWEFCWVSGNSNVGRHSVIKACKNLKDISYVASSSVLLGFTQDEIIREESYLPYILGCAYYTNDTHFSISSITSYYGGYNFNGFNEHLNFESLVFDPWSLLNYLQDRSWEYPNYRPGFFPFLSWLEKYVLSQPLNDLPRHGCTENMFDFQLTDEFEHGRFSLLSLLTQLGFLTIHHHSKALIAVGYPNWSVEDYLKDFKKYIASASEGDG